VVIASPPPLFPRQFPARPYHAGHAPEPGCPILQRAAINAVPGQKRTPARPLHRLLDDLRKIPFPEAMATGGGGFSMMTRAANILPRTNWKPLPEVRFMRELRLFPRLLSARLSARCGLLFRRVFVSLNRRHPGDYKILGTDVSTAPLNTAEKNGCARGPGQFPGRLV